MADKANTLTVKVDDAIHTGEVKDGEFVYFKKGDKITPVDEDAAESLRAKGLAE